jgi:hypothetical protein
MRSMLAEARATHDLSLRNRRESGAGQTPRAGCLAVEFAAVEFAAVALEAAWFAVMVVARSWMWRREQLPRIVRARHALPRRLS